jgi:hypothetical protein
MLFALDALTVLLGKPQCHSLVSDERRSVRISVNWACGCTATGPNSARLVLAGCAAHASGRRRDTVAATELVPGR